LKNGCRELKDNETIRGKLAVHFTNCHIEKSNLAPYICTDEMTINQCTSNMVSSPTVYNAYTLFTTHVESLCYLVQSEVFNHRIEGNIENLSKNSIKAENLLGDLGEKTNTIHQIT